MAIRFKQKLCTMFIFVFMLLLFNTPNSGICATITVQTTIQAAIDSASNGDTIVVPDGIYSGSGNYNIDLKAKILTIESENGPENCVIDVGSPSTNGFNFDHPNESNCVLKGLTIQNGRFGIYISAGCSPTIENCTITGNNAAGIYCSSASPSLIDCLISGNTSSGDGAGIYLHSSSPTIQNCVIRDNIATGSGAGILAVNGSNALIDSCIIENNSCLNGDGAGIYSYDSEITIKDCEIRNNSSRDGGGLLLIGSTPSLIDSKIIGNTAQRYGGGLFDTSNGSSFVNCRFEKNKAVYGGGVAVSASSIISSTFDSCWIEDNEAEYGGGLSVAGSAEFKNCIIVNNTASNAGGAAYVSSGTPKFMNCTVMMNTCTNASSPGGIRLASATLTNCILWANAPTQIGGVFSGTVTFSDVQGEGVFPGAGNINADPAVNAGTYYLRSVSPCIDAGTDLGAPLKDYAGDYRPRGVDFDIGAYEYSGVTPTDGQVLSKPYDFAPGATIKASEMNENFDVIYESVSQLKQVVCQDHPGLDFCQ